MSKSESGRSRGSSEAEDYPGAESAFEKLAPRLKAIPSDKVAPFAGYVPQAVSNGLRVASALAHDRASFKSAFKKEAFDPADYGDLALRAQALWFADVRMRHAIDPGGALPVLLEEARPLRAKLLKAASYLWDEDGELGPIVADVRAGSGHLDTADDLVALANLFGARWSEVKGRSAVVEADLPRARGLGTQLIAALQEVSGESDVSTWRDLRDRAGAHLREATEEVRAAASFVFRHEPEALDRYPSIFNSRLRGRRRPKRPGAEPARELEAPDRDEGGPDAEG